jgi:tRNA A-37 threonylcarbamoyl transferase component Bud32
MKKISRDSPSQDSPHPDSSYANRSNKVEEVKFKLVPLEDTVLLEVLGDLAKGVKKLHNRGLIHQLICMDNIFMRKKKVILG